MKKGANKIHFETNFEKALEAVLYVIKKNDKPLNIYNLMKIMFEADRYHLNKYMRPVTGDVYICMEHGTVPSAIYDFTKNDPLTLALMDIPEFPLQKVNVHLVEATRNPRMEMFSESDIEALDHGYYAYASLSVSEVRRKNHSEPCWQNGTINQPISYDDMIDNDEVRQFLKAHPYRIAL